MTWCKCEFPKVRLNCIQGGDVEVVNGLLTNFHCDFVVTLVSVYCEVCLTELAV